MITDSAGVDRLCEEFMVSEFGQDINVMIEGAMTKLTELGLFGGLSDSIESTKDDSIKVKNLKDAIQSIRLHYQSAIQSVRKIKRHFIDTEDETDGVDLEEFISSIRKTDNNGVKEPTPPIISAQDVRDAHFDDALTQ